MEGTGVFVLRNAAGRECIATTMHFAHVDGAMIKGEGEEEE
eukprot:gene7906-4551_t